MVMGHMEPLHAIFAKQRLTLVSVFFFLPEAFSRSAVDNPSLNQHLIVGSRTFSLHNRLVVTKRPLPEFRMVRPLANDRRTTVI